MLVYLEVTDGVMKICTVFFGLNRGAWEGSKLFLLFGVHLFQHIRFEGVEYCHNAIFYRFISKAHIATPFVARLFSTLRTASSRLSVSSGLTSSLASLK